MTDTENRWLIAASAVGIHLPIGSVCALKMTLIMKN